MPWSKAPSDAQHALTFEQLCRALCTTHVATEARWYLLERVLDLAGRRLTPAHSCFGRKIR